MDEIGQYHLFILYAHHQITNARYLVCTKGIPQAGIDKNAWHKVAKDPENRTSLSRPMVEDMIVRQNRSFAAATLSADLENNMSE